MQPQSAGPADGGAANDERISDEMLERIDDPPSMDNNMDQLPGKCVKKSGIEGWQRLTFSLSGLVKVTGPDRVSIAIGWPPIMTLIAEPGNLHSGPHQYHFVLIRSVGASVDNGTQ